MRMPKAYPVYDDTYRDNVEVIRRWFEEHAPNVHPVGRNGMHKYNNQDHSMYTAMLTVENIHGAHHDIWSVNVEEEYHEVTTDRGRIDAGHRPDGRDAPVLPRRPDRTGRAVTSDDGGTQRGRRAVAIERRSARGGTRPRTDPTASPLGPPGMDGAKVLGLTGSGRPPGSTRSWRRSTRWSSRSPSRCRCRRRSASPWPVAR